jgi:FixJ family two-component response regulator
MEQIFLVDDDAAVRRALSRAAARGRLRRRGVRFGRGLPRPAERPAEGCIVLDVTMPGLDGLALQARLREAGRELPIVFLTGHGDIPMSVQAIKAGATDFLTKPATSQALIGAVRSAIAQSISTRQARAERALLQRRLAALTPREREVLAGLVNGRLNKQIAGDLGVVEQTVKWHRAQIMERMQARTVAELMHIAATLGIGSTPPVPPGKD